MKKELQSKDLRIGNWITAHDNDGEIDFITNKEIVGVKGKHLTELKKVKPIPLTEEWLLKFGFEYKVEELGTKFYELQIGISFISLSIEGHFNINSGESYWYMDRDFKTPKYVHELQNLYFALTGEELKLKNVTP